MIKSKIYLLSDEEFIKLVKSSINYSDCLKKLKLNHTGSGSFVILKRRIKELNIDISHFTIKNSSPNKKSNDEIFCENSTFSRHSLKSKILKDNLIEYKCAICGNNGVWNGKEIVLQLDHINGKSNDNRLENLRFLCPNCHSQTDTYSGKNSKHNYKKDKFCKICGKKLLYKNKNNVCRECYFIVNRKVERPTKEQLELDLKEIHNFCAIGRKYGVSDNAVRRWCKNYNIDCNFCQQKEKKYCKNCGKEINSNNKNLYCSKCYKIYIYDKNKPSKEDLLYDIELLKTYTKIGEKYNVSRKTVKRWIKEYKI